MRLSITVFMPNETLAWILRHEYCFLTELKVAQLGHAKLRILFDATKSATCNKITEPRHRIFLLSLLFTLMLSVTPPDD
jgi:hypothetical protein